MSDTCDKNMMGTTEAVTLGVAIEKILGGAWELARNVNTGNFLGLNKSIIKARGEAEDRFSDNPLVMVISNLADGSIKESFRFYAGDFSIREWVPCNLEVCYTLDPLDCLKAIRESDDILVFEYEDSLGNVHYISEKSLATKGVPPGALKTRWRKAKLDNVAILL